MQLDALLKFVLVDGNTATAFMDFPRVPESGLELFTEKHQLRLKLPVGPQEWMFPVDVKQWRVTASPTAHHHHVSVDLRVPARFWAFSRNRRLGGPALSLRVEIERLQGNLFLVEPQAEEGGQFINERARERRSRAAVGGG